MRRTHLRVAPTEFARVTFSGSTECAGGLSSRGRTTCAGAIPTPDEAGRSSSRPAGRSDEAHPHRRKGRVKPAFTQSPSGRGQASLGQGRVEPVSIFDSLGQASSGVRAGQVRLVLLSKCRRRSSSRLAGDADNAPHAPRHTRTAALVAPVPDTYGPTREKACTANETWVRGATVGQRCWPRLRHCWAQLVAETRPTGLAALRTAKDAAPKGAASLDRLMPSADLEGTCASRVPWDRPVRRRGACRSAEALRLVAAWRLAAAWRLVAAPGLAAASPLEAAPELAAVSRLVAAPELVAV
jgi:hypothetical protein